MNPLASPREYVTHWAKVNNITFDGSMTPVHPERSSLSAIKIQLRLDYDEQVHSANAAIAAGNEVEKMKAASLRQLKKPFRVFRPDDLLFAFDELILTERQRTFLLFRECIRFSGDSDLTEVSAFVAALTGSISLPDVHSLAHSVWQIKRKMFGLPVVDHTFLVIEGAQGGGKSTAMQKLLSPLSEIHRLISWKVTDLEDSRNHSALSENFAVFFDEMAFASRANIEQIKNLVTSPTLTHRALYSNSTQNLPQNCTFFGATNSRIADLFFDPTGMRRFVGIKCQDVLDWKKINDIDIISLWRSIDENNDLGYLHFSATEIKEFQSALAAESKDDVALWVDELNLIPSPTDEKIAFNISNLYKNYVAFAEENGFKPKNVISFGKRLSALGLENSKNTKTRGRLVNANSSLFLPSGPMGDKKWT